MSALLHRLRKAEPVSDALLLAAIERAVRHRTLGLEYATWGEIAEHLGFIPGSATTRKLRPQVEALRTAGLIEDRRSTVGTPHWWLTSAGRRQAAKDRRAGKVDLPESPQHRAWRRTRAEASRRIDGIRAELRDMLAEATALLDTDGGGDCDAWESLGERLRRKCMQVGVARYQLDEWAEPDDSRADEDPAKRAYRRRPLRMLDQK